MGLIDYKGIFRNEHALNYEFLPKVLPFRENEQKEIANIIQPLLQGRDARNILIYGPPGIGKTAATKYILRDLEQNTDLYPLYINCWKHNTSFKVLVELCHQAGYTLTNNKNTNELLQKLTSILNRNGSVIVLDEVDRLMDIDLLYSLQEELYRKSLIFITNFRDWFANLDQRLRSRLLPTEIEFRKYNREEIRGILLQRIEYAFIPGSWSIDALERVVDKTFVTSDIRVGLFLLRESGRIAEESFSNQVLVEHVEKAISLLPDFSASSEELSDIDKSILSLVKQNPGERIGKLYELYKEMGGDMSYKSFQRRINKLANGKFISIKKDHSRGNTTIVDTRIKDYE